MINEDLVEQQALKWFQEAGWSYLHGSELTPDTAPDERADGRVVVLAGRLTAAVRRLNPQLPDDAVEELVRRATTKQHPDTARANRLFHRLLIDGVPIEYAGADGKKRADQARLIDFTDPAANDLLVVNQFVVQGTKCLRRPDLVAFVNGLPLAVIELKKPADENADLWKAYHQLQTYKDEIGDLFVYNTALVISDGVTARVGSLTANPNWFMPWRTVNGPDDKPAMEFELEKIVRGFFRPDLLLDYVRYFVLFEDDGDAVVKKIAG